MSGIAKRNPAFGALVASLTLVSILAMIWLWSDTRDSLRISAQAESRLWLVLPSLSIFLVLPAMLRSGLSFWPSLDACCALTIALYLLMAWLLPKIGIAS